MTGPTAAVAASASGVVVYWSGERNLTQVTWVSETAPRTARSVLQAGT